MAASENIRLFVAIDLPKEIKEQIKDLQKEIDMEGVKLVEEENLHLTLCFIGDTSKEDFETIKEKLKQLYFKSFTISVRGTGSFPNKLYPRVLFLYVEPATKVRVLSEQIHSLLDVPVDKEIVPHITIARVKFFKDKGKIISFVNRWSNKQFGSFKVERIKLYSSKLTSSGPEYKKEGEVLAFDCMREEHSS